jgi:hypothetical protein
MLSEILILNFPYEVMQIFNKVALQAKFLESSN